MDQDREKKAEKAPLLGANIVGTHISCELDSREFWKDDMELGAMLTQACPSQSHFESPLVV